MISKINPELLLIIQPAFSDTGKIWTPDKLTALYDFFQHRIKNIRIIPQIHKLMSWI